MKRAISLLLALTLVAGCGGEESGQGHASEAGSGGGGDGGGDGGAPRPPEAGYVPLACAPGELELEGGVCQPAGIPENGCGVGAEPSGDGSCVPVLPASPCPNGEMAIPGETICAPLSTCGSGTWGDIPVEPGSHYVDGAYPGGDSDGSAAKPWTTIQDAIAAAAPDTLIAIAPGTYAGQIDIVGKPVRLWGKCTAEVVVAGASPGTGFYVGAGADGSEIHDLTLRDGDTGIFVVDSANILFERVWLHDQLGTGVWPWGPAAGVVLRRSLVERATYNGVYVQGARFEIDESVVRDTRPGPEGYDGRGLVAAWGSDLETPADLIARRSLFERNRAFGLRVTGSTALIEDVVVLDTQQQQVDGLSGQGIHIQAQYEPPVPSSATLRRVIVEDSHDCGLCAFDSDVDLEAIAIRRVDQSDNNFIAMGILGGQSGQIGANRPVFSLRESTVEDVGYVAVGTSGADATFEGVLIRDVHPNDDGEEGRGLSIETDPLSTEPGVGVVRGCLVERVSSYGIAVVGSEVEIETTAVRDVTSSPVSGMFGRGIGVEASPVGNLRSSGTVRGCLIERATEIGLTVIGSDLTAESVMVRETRARPLDGWFGRGAAVQMAIEGNAPASAIVRRSTFEDNVEAGVTVVAAQLTLQRSIVRGTLARALDDSFGDGVLAYTAKLSPAAPLEQALLDVDRSIVEGSARAGVSSFSATVTLGSSWLECNTVQINGEAIDDLPYSFSDAGDNHCTCAGESSPCKVLSSNLTPPPVL